MGKLIIIEGTDGSGKQTQTELLYKKLCKLKGKEKRAEFANHGVEKVGAELRKLMPWIKK